MKEDDVRHMAADGHFHGKVLHGKVEETHISWVILSGRHAFKIKKPLRLSFLDFSTKKLRKEFCEREVEINRRFSTIYLGVLPVRKVGDHWQLGGTMGQLSDYAVHMKRMAQSRRMDHMLSRGKVTPQDIRALSAEIAAFHQVAQKVFTPFHLHVARQTFNDILGVSNILSEHLGPAYSTWIREAVTWSNQVLKAHANRFRQRIREGLQRDVHGDLHSANIFLYRRPVLFDGLEFNDMYRQIDVLYELAYLGMDLEAFGQPGLAKLLVQSYLQHFPCVESREDRLIYVYFKCLRANIRAKVHAMSILQADTPDESRLHIHETRRYLKLIRRYIRQ